MSTVAVVGAGQLGQMLGEAGKSLGIVCRFLDPGESPPALSVGEVLRYDYDDAEGLRELADGADVITYEFENVPVAAVAALTDRTPVYPPPGALRAAQDRLREKQLFERLGIPTSPFCNVESAEDVHDAAGRLGLPLVFKTRRFGYDGKGQAVARSPADLGGLWDALGSVPLIAERFVNFDREVSIIGARSVSGDIVTYPLTENRHASGILRVSLAPYEDEQLHALASGYHRSLLEDLDYIGVLALEMFVVEDRLVANEFAPRVHNSGHWTIEGAATSQFENHLRAVLDLPLGDTAALGHSVMVNLIGAMPDRRDELRSLGGHLHDYGKSPRPGRKLGHVTSVSRTPGGRDEALGQLTKALADR